MNRMMWIAGGFLATALLGGLTWGYHAVKDMGAQEERANQEQANDLVRKDAEIGRTTVLKCRDANGVWDRAKGACGPSVRGPE
jgi:hypothetical protein